jgi:hypothetical protein
VEQYEQLAKPKTRLTGFFRQSPLYDAALDLERNNEQAREVE